MSYENPPLPQDVNVSRESPLVEFLRLAVGLAVFVAAAAAALYFGGSRLARFVPFEMEKNMVGEFVVGIDAPAAGDAEEPVASYLQEVTDRLAAQMNLPESMKLRVHFVDTAVPNAFATLGGHIAVTRGLYEEMDTENELALVLAHEIAHIRARDPIAGLGGSATLTVILALAGADASNLSGAFAAVVQRGYSRSAEAAADDAAVEALRRVYGHAGGVTAVFEKIGRQREGFSEETAWFLSTHPMDAQRTARLEAAGEGWDSSTQPLRLLAVPAPRREQGPTPGQSPGQGPVGNER